MIVLFTHQNHSRLDRCDRKTSRRRVLARQRARRRYPHLALVMLLRFRWAIVDTADTVQVHGFDVGELAAHGRLRRISGSFGPFPPAPDSWPDRLVLRRPRAGES